MVKKILDLNKMTLNIAGNYKNTEFYPRNYTLANGEVIVKNAKDQTVTILISIIKVNQTEFSSLFENVDSAEKCRELFKDDVTMDKLYQETLSSEEYCVTLVYCLPNKFRFYPYSYISKSSIATLDEFITDQFFNKELQVKIDELVRISDQCTL